MSELPSSILDSRSSCALPSPKVDVGVREATLDDVAFIDALQREHAKQLGFLARSWIEGKIEAGQVIIAEGSGVRDQGSRDAASSPLLTPDSRPLTPLGYCISQDKYLKRDELGLIVQLCVAKGVQRNLIGATLVKAAFERAAYGCRLFCLWCAQDIEANRFWESIGFVPLAYRGGSEKNSRVHIFWQKRIREGDETTPWWFPSKTDQGAMRADRIVLPIPLGKHWSDELPVLQIAEPATPELTDKRAGKKSAAEKDARKARPRQFDGPAAGPEPEVVVGKPKQGGREKTPKAKADPKLVAAARELRDRWLEQVNAGQYVFADARKYDVTRALPALPALPAPAPGEPVKLLAA